MSVIYGIGIVVYHLFLSYDRFKFLIHNLAFCSENEDDFKIMHSDIMKWIYKVFEMFTMNCRTAFDIQNVAVINEIIVPVFGPCPFIYETPKRAKKLY